MYQIQQRTPAMRFFFLAFAVGVLSATNAFAANATINLDQSSLSFTAIAGGTNPASQTVNLTNTGPGGTTLNWTTAATKYWLQVSPYSGTTTTGTSPLAVQAFLSKVEAWKGATQTAGAPAIRGEFSTVWTGTEMIIWGGHTKNNITGVYGALGDGFRYNPATNTWSGPISAVNAPSARFEHTAVWTGSEMIIWGGDSILSGPFRTGYRYDPKLDMWTGQTTVTNAPAARHDHTAIWTGSTMIIWGGRVGSVDSQDGAIYDPVGDTWTGTTSLINAPAGRWRQSAVWTGTEMIIWGGGDNFIGYYTDGGRYNPASDTWTPIASLPGTPTARVGHEAVWTGTEMVVWGGLDRFGASVKTGARYNPVTNSWSLPTTLTGAPAGRSRFGAVWTGSEMIVWGGTPDNSGSYINTGDRYQPPYSLSAGIYTDTVTVQAPGATNTPRTISVTLTVTGLAIVESSGITDVTENGASDSYSVALGTMPAANVTVTPNSDTVNGVTTSGPITFTPANWNVPQIITVTAVNDGLSEGITIDTITHTMTSTDGTYNGAANTFVAARIHDPAPSIGLSPGSLAFQASADGPNPAAQPASITNPTAGAASLSWTVGATKPWLTVSPYSGITTSGTSTVSIQAVASRAEAWLSNITTTGAPTARSVHSAIWTGRIMIVWGGISTSSTYHNDGTRYDPVSNTWLGTISTVNAPSARNRHSAVWTGTEMIIWGGYDGTNQLSNGGRYNPVSDTWAPMNSINAPLARDNHTAVWTGTEMIIWGGANIGTPLNTGGRYNPATDTWTGATSIVGALSPRLMHSAVWSGTEMIVWGGSDGIYTTSVTYNTGARYNPTTNAWTGATATLNAPLNRTAHRAVWTGNEMVIWGGYDGGSWRNAGGRYDPVNDKWLGATPSAFAPPTRAAHSAVWTGREMIVWGGYNGASYLNDGPRYQPPIHLTPGTYTDTVTVSDPNATNNPRTIPVTFTVVAPEISLSAVSLGFTAPTAGPNPAAQTVNLTNPGPAPSQLTLTALSGRPWIRVSPTDGVTTSGTSVLSIQPLLTQAEMWNGATSGTGAPSTRTGACAAWTGKEMIVWSGQGPGGFLNDGGRYNPATNTWVAITTTNAPGARTYASAVWTGREMIIWGGYNGTQLPDGARYNPYTDTWAIGLSNTNRPSARYGHSAVWTGSEMLIWAGNIGSGPVQNGNRYNPVSDTWTAAIPSTAAPSARSFHSAVWTGSEMIVWGGNSGSVVNTGGRFSPASNTWTAATSTTGAPAARSGHTAVWTGDEMIVWGGDNGLGTLYRNDGMIYRPASDTWGPATTLTGVPTARGGQVAAWSGTEMIVWGGYASGAYNNSGDRYQPAFNLTAGVHTGTITVADPHATNNSQSITVSLSVSNTANVAPTVVSPAGATPNPVVSANTTSVSLTASDPDSGPAALTYTWWKISGPGNVTFSPNGTTTANTATATFSASGTYSLGVAVSDGAAIVTDSIVGIVVTLNPVTFGVTNLSFTGTVGSTTPVSQSLTVTNTSGSTLTVSLSDAEVWLSSTALGGGAPSLSIPPGGTATFTVTADPTGLNGVYNGTLTITNTPGGATQTLPISFSVQPGPPSSGGKKSKGCTVGAMGAIGGEWALLLGLALIAAGLQRRRREGLA